MALAIHPEPVGTCADVRRSVRLSVRAACAVHGFPLRGGGMFGGSLELREGWYVANFSKKPVLGRLVVQETAIWQAFQK